MNRRLFLSLFAATFVVPLQVAAQQPGRVYRVGVFLAGQDSPEYRKLNQILIDELGQLGFVRGRNLDVRFVFGPDEAVPAQARELIAMRPDAFIASGDLRTRTLQSLTKTIPIVFVADDPRELVADPLRPGGNATGISRLSCELTPKLLELLRELAPNARRMVLVSSPQSPCNSDLEALTPKVKATIVMARKDEGATMQAISRERPDAILLNIALPDGATSALALNHRIPIAARYSAPGVIVSLQRDIPEVVRRHARLVAKILNGASPGEIPVEFPREFHLTVNKKIAREIGVRIPESILLRASRTVE